MPRGRVLKEEETELLAKDERSARNSEDGSEASTSSISTTSLVLEHINDPSYGGRPHAKDGEKYRDDDNDAPGQARARFDVEEGHFQAPATGDKKLRRLLWLVGTICVLGWALALVSFLMNGSYKHASSRPHDPLASSTKGSGRKITMDQVLGGEFWPKEQSVSWIAGPNGEDGLLLEKNVANSEYLVVEDVRGKNNAEVAATKSTLMKKSSFEVDGKHVYPSDVWPSKNFKKVLVMSNQQKNWRHSFTGLYWIFDVDTQTAEPLDPENPRGRVQLASLSPQSDAVVFTRDNNMYLRKLDSNQVVQITQDGGSELFYGNSGTGFTRKRSSKRTAQLGGLKMANMSLSYGLMSPRSQRTQCSTLSRVQAETSQSLGKRTIQKFGTSSTPRLARQIPSCRWNSTMSKKTKSSVSRLRMTSQTILASSLKLSGLARPSKCWSEKPIGKVTL